MPSSIETTSRTKSSCASEGERPPFTVRYPWAPGTVAIWDNRITQHYVVIDFTEPRVLHRVTVLGDDPQPAGDTTRWPAWKPARLSAATADSDR